MKSMPWIHFLFTIIVILFILSIGIFFYFYSEIRDIQRIADDAIKDFEVIEVFKKGRNIFF